MNPYDVLSGFPTRAAVRVALLVMLGLLLRLVAVPLALAALLAARLMATVDAMAAVRPAPPLPRPPRWAAANTRTGTYAAV